jgi:hypothetical protein
MALYLSVIKRACNQGTNKSSELVPAIFVTRNGPKDSTFDSIVIIFWRRGGYIKNMSVPAYFLIWDLY